MACDQLAGEAEEDEAQGAEAEEGVSEEEWVSPRHVLPVRGQRIEWLTRSGRLVQGSYEGVFLMDCGVYVYYEPALWRPR